MRHLTAEPALAVRLAQGEFARIVTRESLTLAFNDAFRLMAWLFLAALVLVPFCRPPTNQSASAPVEAH